MEIDRVRQEIEKNYDIRAYTIEKIKNVYKINTKNSEYCLKVIKYNLSHFIFILNAIRYLQLREFNSIPEIIKTKNNMDYISMGGCYAYLTEWIKARECNYDNPVDVMIASSKLAELHKKSEGFTVSNNMKPRIGWLKWIQNYNIRINEINDFKEKILQKSNRTEFDNMYLENMEEEIIRAEKSVEDLQESDYIINTKKEIQKRGFCHHDYAHHNILIDENKSINIIDFDYCILDSHLHDLASLLIRVMKNGKWDIQNASYILQCYSPINYVEQSDIPIMSGFMEFPQDYWQVGIQYYWEKQPWGEDFFIKKLEKIIEDREEKQEFIEEFKLFKI